MLVIVKIGTSSLTDARGDIDQNAIDKLCSEVSDLRGSGHSAVIITSGAITAGLTALDKTRKRPHDTAMLQAAAAVGQSRLLRRYDAALEPFELIAGQLLLSPNSFFDRKQYLNARNALEHLLALGVVPVVNENDAVADEDIRFGDNDRIAALVAHALRADLLVMLTDTAGVLTSDPALDASASLVEEIVEIDQALLQATDSAGTRGSGGMSAKLAAARMAAHSGVRTIIADATRPSVLQDAANAVAGVGTVIHARPRSLSARKLWIAFAVPSAGRIVVDEGARVALTDGHRSLLPAGVRGVEGDFKTESAVEVVDEAGNAFAKGFCRYSATQLKENAGRRTSDVPSELPNEVIHRDDLVILA